MAPEEGREEGPTLVTAGEYGKAIHLVMEFSCPLGKGILEIKDCVGDDCLSGEWLTKCAEFLGALQLLRKVRDGEVEVK